MLAHHVGHVPVPLIISNNIPSREQSGMMSRSGLCSLSAEAETFPNVASLMRQKRVNDAGERRFRLAGDGVLRSRGGRGSPPLQTWAGNPSSQHTTADEELYERR